MKRNLLIGTLGAALVFGGTFAVSAAKKDDGNEVDNAVKNGKTILSTNEVEKIALQEVNWAIEEIELEKEADKVIYEVEVEENDIDYKLDIDAYTGEIYSIDRDEDDDDDNRPNGGQEQPGILSQAEATAIAEKTVNGKMTEIKKDEDDGIIKFEVELKTDRGEAEVDIDAATGKVLDVEYDD
ncbi:PepSY domain-containing protein [Bacillus sp. FJAT-27251]|uniref:PepSY domain-containing protein n=1 Tax=Bacillus sp. FJAT-27251 TaxID=1684142 RepID=UPI0006A7A4C8|nr:PepSY domain-containing protein [Bacillus sp. FJAT-27251]